MEQDRITLPAPVAERIVAIDVRQGQRVVAGQTLFQLDSVRTHSATDARADAQRKREALAELEVGSRGELIAQRGPLAAAKAPTRNTRAYYSPLQLVARQRLGRLPISTARRRRQPMQPPPARS